MHENGDKNFAGIGESKEFISIVDSAKKFAQVPRPILIRGERGTGKEVLAQFIHNQSPRIEQRFVAINCAALHDELFVSEIFGHEKGAFTGATASRKGKLELAHNGTLFLDEVANMPRDAQEKLLRVVEYQSFERLGGTEEITVDVRIIAATNADLSDMIQKGEFHADLYDRIAFAELVLPPLRRRREDIPLLIEHFLKNLHREMPDIEKKAFTPAAMHALQSYHWPGNMRELKNVIERHYIWDSDGIIHSSELPLEITTTEPMGGTFHDQVRAFEKSLLLNTLKDVMGNQREAAKRLGMTYDQFRHYYKKYSLGELLV
ncbi:MAG: AAA family ATPase [Calditrichaeota bacterium]|nr:MAG: AAA family ATPase [Calditrichota bacterium]